MKPGLRSGFAYVYDDDVAADIKAGRLVRMQESGCPTFPGYISITASRWRALPAFTALIAALCCKFQLRNGKLSAGGGGR
jgi:hypothetical protein